MNDPTRVNTDPNPTSTSNTDHIDSNINNTNNIFTNNDNNTTKSCSCKSKCLFMTCCLLTFAIIGGFGFLFGPLILQRNYPLNKFTPSQIQVHHYRLRLEPKILQENKQNNNNVSDPNVYYHGRASIVFNNTQRTNELRLLSHNLHIESVNLTKSLLMHLNTNATQTKTNEHLHFGQITNIEIDKMVVQNNQKHNEIIFILKNPLELGNYLLDIQYLVQFNLFGLKLTTYEDNIEEKDGNEVKKHKNFIVMNQDVSRVFPYFDNNQKIKFELSIGRKTDVSCFTNVEFKEIEIIKTHPGYVWEHFKTTPEILPTSLGIIIADYKSVNVSIPNSPVIVKILTSKKHHNQLSYTRDIFPIIFEYFEEYFQIKYPLHKLDILLIENDLSAYTSKLGLITLNNEHLLLDIIDDNRENRRKIFLALSEAVAVQWLQLQLNYNEDFDIIRGFAKYLAYNAEYLLNQVKNQIDNEARESSNWNSEEYFVENSLEKSLNDFGKEKGLKMACILRMVNYTLNKDVVQPGLSKLLFNSKYEFWKSTEHLNLEENTTNKQFLQSWWVNTGYPIVTMTRTTGWNILITQQSSLLENLNDTFIIPINYISQNNKEGTSGKHTLVTLSSKQITKNLFVPQENWILLNSNRIGYYRVNYQLENWNKLIKQLNEQPDKIPVINRAALISDAFALADQDLLNFETAFRLINYLRLSNDSHYLPWRAAIDALNRHEGVFLDISQYGVFMKYKINLLSKLWPLRHELTPKLVELVETELCRLQYKPCVQWALEVYEKLKNRKDVAIPQWVFCTAMNHPIQTEEFDFIYDRLNQSMNHNQQRAILHSLTCTNSFEVNRLLEDSMNNLIYAKQIWSSMSLTSWSRISGLLFLETTINDSRNNETSDSTNKNNEENMQDSIKEFKNEVWKIIIEEFLSKMSKTTQLNKIKAISTQVAPSLEENFNSAMLQVKREIDWSEHYLEIFTSEILKYVAQKR